MKNSFFDRNRLVQKQRKEFDSKNVIFIKYQGDFVPYKLNVTKAYYDKFLIQMTNAMRTSFSQIVFPNARDVKNFMFIKGLVFANSCYPFCLKKTVQN